jgi:hypothetical protein
MKIPPVGDLVLLAILSECLFVRGSVIFLVKYVESNVSDSETQHEVEETREKR